MHYTVQIDSCVVLVLQYVIVTECGVLPQIIVSSFAHDDAIHCHLEGIGNVQDV